MLALIDGDVVVYRAAFAAQKTKICVENYETETIDYLPEKMTKTDVIEYLKEYREEYGTGYSIYPVVTTEPVFHAFHNANQIIKSIVEKTGCDRYEVYISGDNNFRYDLATIQPYKANRPEKPVHYAKVREHLILKHGAKIVNGQEADDMLGIQQCSRSDTIICSVDKDLKMIPGQHYDIVKGEFTLISEFDGYKNFYTQVVIGDTTDNIPGIRGMGPIRTSRLLEDAKTEYDLYNKVHELYKTHGQQEKLCEIANLLWIRRKENQQWQPPERK